MWIILDINYNLFYHTGKSQVLAVAWYVFSPSKPHSRTLWTTSGGSSTALSAASPRVGGGTWWGRSAGGRTANDSRRPPGCTLASSIWGLGLWIQSPSTSDVETYLFYLFIVNCYYQILLHEKYMGAIIVMRGFTPILEPICIIDSSRQFPNLILLKLKI